jgi:hypothetical protein
LIRFSPLNEESFPFLTASRERRIGSANTEQLAIRAVICDLTRLPDATLRRSAGSCAAQIEISGLCRRWLPQSRRGRDTKVPILWTSATSPRGHGRGTDAAGGKVTLLDELDTRKPRRRCCVAYR